MELQKSLLDTWKLFSRFLNTLTTGEYYSLVSRDNRMQKIQMHLSQKKKGFVWIFCCIFRIWIKFQTFPKKDELHSLRISEITDH